MGDLKAREISLRFSEFLNYRINLLAFYSESRFSLIDAFNSLAVVLYYIFGLLTGLLLFMSCTSLFPCMIHDFFLENWTF